MRTCCTSVIEGGILEDPWNEPDEAMFQMTVSPEKAPDKPTYLEIEFENGDPVALDGVAMEPLALFTRLNKLGGANGIGRLDLVENRFVGMKSRGVYETPGGTILRAAHRALETITLDREVMKIRDSLVPRYSELIYNGFWFSPERELLQTTMDATQKTVNGTVRLKLYKGNCIGRWAGSPISRSIRRVLPPSRRTRSTIRPMPPALSASMACGCGFRPYRKNNNFMSKQKKAARKNCGAGVLPRRRPVRWRPSPPRSITTPGSINTISPAARPMPPCWPHQGILSKRRA